MRVAMNRAKTFQTLTQTVRSLLTLLGANIDTVNLLKRMCVLFIKCFDACQRILSQKLLAESPTW